LWYDRRVKLARGSASLIILAIIALLVIAGGAYYLSTRHALTPSVQATSIATTTDTTNQGQTSSTTVPLFIFSNPTGAVVGTDAPITVTWSPINPTLLKQFPDLSLELVLIDNGGDEAPLSTKNVLPLTQTSFVWNVADSVHSFPPIFTPDARFHIEARLGYDGNANFTCDPTVKGECDPIFVEPIQSEITAAKNYISDSSVFSIDVSSTTAALSCTISSPTPQIAAGAPFLLNWNGTNTQLAYITGQGTENGQVATWGDEKITLTDPGTYAYSLVENGYDTNPGTTTCSTTVTVQ
jgi:hypothetical protein